VGKAVPPTGVGGRRGQQDGASEFNPRTLSSIRCPYAQPGETIAGPGRDRLCELEAVGAGSTIPDHMEIDGHRFGYPLAAKLDLETLAPWRLQLELEKSDISEREIDRARRDLARLQICTFEIEGIRAQPTIGSRPSDLPQVDLREVFVQSVEHTIRRIHANLVQSTVVVERGCAARKKTGTLQEAVKL
jgi:hypothetical protein